MDPLLRQIWDHLDRVGSGLDPVKLAEIDKMWFVIEQFVTSGQREVRRLAQEKDASEKKARDLWEALVDVAKEYGVTNDEKVG